jgi:microcystin-dependent protein
MSCSNCGSNGLTSCSCNDNCPDKTSELTFDGTLTSVPIPDGATLNDVILLLEEYVMNSIDALNFEYVISDLNCIGLPAGTYGYNQVFDAINTAICSLSNELMGISDDIVTINGNIADIQGDITNIQSDITNIESSIVSIVENMPLGAMMLYVSSIVPNAKWMRCEGQSLSTSLYADLFSVVGYSFGGSGISFSLPDLRSQFVAGYDSTGAVEYQTIGQGGGQDSVTLTKTQIPKHKHTVGTGDGATITNPGNHTHNGGYAFNAILEGGDVPADLTWDLDEGGAVGPEFKRVGGFPYADGAHIHTGVTGDGTSDAIGGLAHENRPSFVAFPWIIKVAN